MDPSSPLRKKRRFSQEATRKALIEAGKQLLVDRGLDTGLGLVSLNDAILQSGVARASAYRVFTEEDLDPQVAFRAELLVSYIDEDPLEAVTVAADQIATQAIEALQADDPVERAAMLRETIRIGYAGTVAGLADDPNWRVVGPSWAATAMNQWAPDELVDAHRAGSLKSSQRFLPLFRRICGAGGLRLRSGFTWELVGLLAHSTVITSSFHQRYHPTLSTVMRPTGSDGETQPWSQAAIMVEGLVLTAFEPDPEAPVTADLATWID